MGSAGLEGVSPFTAGTVRYTLTSTRQMRLGADSVDVFRLDRTVNVGAGNVTSTLGEVVDFDLAFVGRGARVEDGAPDASALTEAILSLATPRMYQLRGRTTRPRRARRSSGPPRPSAPSMPPRPPFSTLGLEAASDTTMGRLLLLLIAGAALGGYTLASSSMDRRTGDRGVQSSTQARALARDAAETAHAIVVGDLIDPATDRFRDVLTVPATFSAGEARLVSKATVSPPTVGLKPRL